MAREYVRFDWTIELAVSACVTPTRNSSVLRCSFDATPFFGLMRSLAPREAERLRAIAVVAEKICTSNEPPRDR